MQTISRRLLREHDRYYTNQTFRSQPLCAEYDGGPSSVASVMLFPEAAFEYRVLGSPDSVQIPVIGATGLDVALSPTNDTGVEITQGITARGPSAFTTGTDTFYGKLTVTLSDVSGTDDCAFGFRKAEAYQAAVDDYADMAALNVISGNITIETIKSSAATTSTDTTDNFADGETHVLEVYVSSAGVVTYKIDGVAPTATAAYTFTSALTVVPFFYFLHASDVCDSVALTGWEVGLQ